MGTGLDVGSLLGLFGGSLLDEVASDSLSDLMGSAFDGGKIELLELVLVAKEVLRDLIEKGDELGFD